MCKVIKCENCGESLKENEIKVRTFKSGRKDYLCFDCYDWIMSENSHADYDDCPSCGGGGCISCRPSWFI